MKVKIRIVENSWNTAQCNVIHGTVRISDILRALPPKFGHEYRDLEEPVHMDEFDLRILDVLQNDSSLSAQSVAERVGLSGSATQKRIKRLWQSGAILKQSVTLSPEALGGYEFLLVQVQTRNEGQGAILKFREVIVERPEVLQCFHVTGPFDFAMLIATRTMDEYESFVETVLTTENSVQRYETSVVLRTVKLGFALPLKS